MGIPPECLDTVATVLWHACLDEYDSEVASVLPFLETRVQKYLPFLFLLILMCMILLFLK